MIFRKNKINNYYNNKAKLSKIYIEKNHVDLFFHFFEIHKYEFEFCIKLDDNYVKSIIYEDNPKKSEDEHYIVKYNDYEYWMNYDKAMYTVKNLMCLKMIEKNFIVDIKMRQKNSKEICDEDFVGYNLEKHLKNSQIDTDDWTAVREENEEEDLKEIMEKIRVKTEELNEIMERYEDLKDKEVE